MREMTNETTPEEGSQFAIDAKLNQSGWVIEDTKKLNLSATLGVTIRKFPIRTGEIDYALLVEGLPVGVVETKREEAGENITDVEVQSDRFVNSKFKWVKGNYSIRFVHEAIDKIISALVHKSKFEESIRERIGKAVDTAKLKQQLSTLRQSTSMKNRFAEKWIRLMHLTCFMSERNSISNSVTISDLKNGRTGVPDW